MTEEKKKKEYYKGEEVKRGKVRALTSHYFIATFTPSNRSANGTVTVSSPFLNVASTFSGSMV